MRHRIVELCLLVAAGSLGAQTDAWSQAAVDDGSLVEVRPYTFPAYEHAYGYTRVDGSQDAIDKYWTREEYERAVSDPRFVFEKLVYRSDGLDVVAYVYRPRDTREASPVIVFNRGSGVHKDIAPVLVPYLHRIAQEGYVLIAPMYRGSDGGAGNDGNGGDDVHDLLNLLPLIESLRYADADDIFMTGESRGAMMVYQAIREGFPLRAAAVWGGFTDLGQLFEAQPGLVRYAAEHWPGFDPGNPDAEIRRRSAIYWPEQFRVPVLMMHGERDRSVPVEHTYNLAMALQELGRLYGLIVFADDDHILSGSQLERDRASVRWFRRFSSQGDLEAAEFLRTRATEREVNARGYGLLERGRIADALRVFRINVARFPESANAHDSLGEALAIAGDTTGAIASYEQALERTGTADGERISQILRSLQGEPQPPE